MKKTLLISGGLILVVILLIVILGIYKFNFTNDDIYIKNGDKTASKDATYLIEGQSVTLKNGSAESESAPNSASKNITRYFGNEVSGDLNGDGQIDKAFLLTQDGGGSGTFYYLAVALATNNGYEGLNTILLGDRIAPQTTEFKDGQIIVNYAERKADEAMTVAPSIGVSRFFRVADNQLVEINQQK
ncbi:MAG: hypothetical protein WCK59_03000 [Candidatus Falkowbacteria bacterium]